MDRYLERVLPDIREFFGAKYKSAPGPHHYYFIPEGPPIQSYCGELNKDAYAYCPRDSSVYLGQAFMWRLYSEVGDIAPAIALAHEWGHHIQSLKGVPSDESVKYETQADCVAGSWLQYADQQKRLEQEDFRSIKKLGEFLRKLEGANSDHGTPEQRSEALSLGRKGGLEACNSFYPATPIFTGRD